MFFRGRPFLRQSAKVKCKTEVRMRQSAKPKCENEVCASQRDICPLLCEVFAQRDICPLFAAAIVSTYYH